MSEPQKTGRGYAWLAEDDEALMQLFQAGTPRVEYPEHLKRMGSRVERSKMAITHRLVHLGLVGKDAKAITPAKKAARVEASTPPVAAEKPKRRPAKKKPKVAKVVETEREVFFVVSGTENSEWLSDKQEALDRYAALVTAGEDGNVRMFRAEELAVTLTARIDGDDE